MFQHIRTTLKDRAMMRTIFLLAWPTMLEEALQCIVTYADTAQVGVMGANASAAIGLTTTVTWMTFYPLYAAGMSVTSAISIALGAKDTQRAKKAASQAVLLVLILGLTLMVLTLAVSSALPRWLGGAQEIRRDATVYFAIICTPMLFRAASIIMGSALRATGNTKTPMLISTLMNVINIILNFLFISPTRPLTVLGHTLTVWGAGWGVAGAGIASAISLVIGGTLMTVAAWRSPVLGLCVKTVRYDRDVMGQCVRVGVPIAGERVLFSFGQVVFTAITARLGTVAMAAHSIALAAEQAFYIPGYGMQTAAATLAGYSAGEKSEKRLMQYSSTIMFIATVLMAVLSAALFLFAEPIMSIFTPDQQVVELGGLALRIVAVSEPFFAVLVILEGIFSGLGDTKAPFVFSLISMWGVRITTTWLCVTVFHFGLGAVWACMAIDNMTRFTMMMVRFLRGKWKRRLELD
ncbi:MAG: MATE family efflux transporter [Clostridia bacterium]|nr:MATE family efflux transporter [Clostridia bacterium]